MQLNSRKCMNVVGKNYIYCKRRFYPSPTSFLYYKWSIWYTPAIPPHLPVHFGMFQRNAHYLSKQNDLTNLSLSLCFCLLSSLFLFRKSNPRVITTTATVRMLAVKTMWMTTAPGTLSKPHSECDNMCCCCLVWSDFDATSRNDAWICFVLSVFTRLVWGRAVGLFIGNFNFHSNVWKNQVFQP